MQRPEPAANLQILRSAYGPGNVLQVAPSQLMVSMDRWTKAQLELEIHTEPRVPLGCLGCDILGRQQQLAKLNALLMYPSGKHKRKQTNARKSLSRYVVAS